MISRTSPHDASGRLKKLAISLNKETAPFSFILEDELKSNISIYKKLVRASGKTLRVATKSLRVPDLFTLISRELSDVQTGFMTFNAEETHFLYGQGFRNFLLAYPCMETGSLAQALTILRQEDAGLWQNSQQPWKKFPGVQFTVSQVEHLDALRAAASHLDFATSQYFKIPIVLDLDMAYRIFGQTFGVRRSGLRNYEDLEPLLEQIQKGPFLLSGILAYEAQIAGLPDWNVFLRFFKKISMRDVLKRRAKLREESLASVDNRNIFFNGGGSGSILESMKDPNIDEITVGSGFLMPHLFDYYENLAELALRPAQYFSLRVTRKPKAKIVVCQSGGFIASGQVGEEKAPRVAFPPDYRQLRNEGFGEVQTPLKGEGDLNIGDLVFCRPAKSGESLDCFTEVLLVDGAAELKRAVTYRGSAKSFR